MLTDTDVTSHAARPERFVVLDGLRGVAAFAVIADHVPSALIRALIPGRYLAVDFFFVLSGFVLCHAYGERLKSEIRSLSFLKLRLVRLYPLYLLGIMLGALHLIYLSLFGYSETALSSFVPMAALSLMFLPVPANISGVEVLYPLTPPSWSLIAALIAHLAYAVRAPWLSLRVLIAVLIVSGLAVFHLVPNEPDLGAGWLLSDVHIGIARAMFGVFAGIAIYRARSAFNMPSVPVWLAVGLLAAILCCPVPEPYRRGFDALACLILMPAIIFFVQNAQASGRIAAIATWLGLVSYGVYVLHEPIYFWMRSVFGFLGLAQPFEVIDFPLVVVLSALAAWLASQFYEQPMRRFLRAFGRT